MRVIFAILLLIGMLYLWKTILLDTINEEDSPYTKTLFLIQKYQKENILLREEILQNQAYTTIAKKAKALGFITGEPIYLRRKMKQ